MLLSFEATQTEFSLTNALACARAALLAYSNDEATVTETAGTWGFHGARTFAKDSNHAIAMHNPEIILVAFRGTDEWRDWITNLNIFYKRSPGGVGYVHRGFMKAVNSFWPDMRQHLAEVRNSNQRIWITGHSLGGAIAFLAAVKANSEDGLPIAGVYTFGQPPVGTVAFCSAFEKRSPFRLFRFVNHTDAVSDVPILTLLEHVGDVRYFDTKGIMWVGDPPWRVSLADHWRAPRLHGGLADFKAHLMQNYVELIAARCISSRALCHSGGTGSAQ